MASAFSVQNGANSGLLRRSSGDSILNFSEIGMVSPELPLPGHAQRPGLRTGGTVA